MQSPNPSSAGLPETPPPEAQGGRSKEGSALAASLAKAQCEMANPHFDRENPHFRNKFASLAAVRNAVIPLLAKHGIAVVQDLVTTDRGVACATILYHEGGETMRLGPLTMPATKADAQGLGSAATYARRYALMSIAGVVGDEDDDANAASDKPAPSNPIVRGDRSGRPDTSKVPTDKAVALADRMREAMGQQDRTEEDIAKDCYSIHCDIRTDAELYTAASDLMQAKERRAWKEWLSIAKNGGANGQV